MSDLDSMNREIKKRQLRRQIVPSPAPQEEDSEEIVRKARKRFSISGITSIRAMTSFGKKR